MTEISAKIWREMSAAEILTSLDIAVEVLRNKKIDADWLKLLLDIGLRCIQIVNDQW